MKIASWNTNSITIRISHTIEVMQRYNLDIIGIQETKTQDANFPIEQLQDSGYHVLFNGQKSYNGTCFISKKKLTNTIHSLPGMEMDYQRRFLQADLDDITIINCYVPNGKEVGDEKYHYKLQWLEALYQHLKSSLLIQKKIILMGDFNICPDDRDVYDVEEWKDKILCSQPERKLLQKIKDLGFTDTFRLFNDQDKQFSWWDYRDGGFQRNKGHRIDLILTTEAIRDNCKSSIIEKEPRSWERPSDHTPVIAEFVF